MVERLIAAAEQVDAVLPDGPGIEEVVGDKDITATRPWWRWPGKVKLDVVLAPVQLGEHPADVVATIALHFQDERGGAPLGIRRVPA